MIEESYLKYWTDQAVAPPNLREFDGFEIRCYFDNDSDELINYHGKDGLVDIEVYRQLVRSVKVMGYNAIDIHDQLGRAEFYLWDRYKKVWNFKGDVNHIEKLIDMIHEEGLLVQIPMYLAWGFNPIGEDCECWSEKCESWKQKWKEYMKSPLGKGDIFLLRPRSPIYDSQYRCSCDACTEKGIGPIMTEVFENLEGIILSKKPDAILVCDLYAEGYDLWMRKSFQVSNRWILVVADNGYGKMRELGKIDKGSNKWGIYLHAGFWLNHTIQDPHIDALSQSINTAYRLGLTNYILVNGQSFKNFIFNIEAIMYMIKDRNNYCRESFIQDWVGRLFHVKELKMIKKIDYLIYKIAEVHRSFAYRKAYLDEQDLDRGFTATMLLIVYKIIEDINRISNFREESIECKYVFLKGKTESHLIQCQELLTLCNEVEGQLIGNSQVAWNDQFTFPIELLTGQCEFLMKLIQVYHGEAPIAEAKYALKNLDALARKGSKLTKFSTWYYPENSRRHHPIPDEDIFEFLWGKK